MSQWDVASTNQFLFHQFYGDDTGELVDCPIVPLNVKMLHDKRMESPWQCYHQTSILSSQKFGFSTLQIVILYQFRWGAYVFSQGGAPYLKLKLVYCHQP